MDKIRLALLSGGISSEREVSLNGGYQVYEALDKDKYEILKYDPATDIKQLVDDAETIDAALLILHGPYGEDGTVQGLLDLLDIPYQGAGVLGSAIAMNKITSKKLYEQAGIPIPPYLVFSKGKPVNLADCIGQLELPLVVKPACAGSSVGMTIVKTPDALGPAIELAFEHDRDVLVEAYIKGRELTCGVLGNAEIEALPVIEIITGQGHEFFDYHAKYVAGASQEICPAPIPDDIRDRVQAYATAAHNALFLKGYSRTDFIFAETGLYVLETNTIPGMTATSLMPQAAAVAGYSFSQFLDRLIELSMEK